MRKLLSIFSYILIAINLFSPLCEIIARVAKLRFELFGYVASSAIVLFLSLIPCVLVFFSEKLDALRRAERILWSLLPLSAILNLIFFIIKSHSAATAALVFLNFVLSLYLSKTLGLKFAFRISLIASVPLVLLVALIVILRPMLSWAAGDNKVIGRYESPDNKYYVELVERSEGAAGGSTRVELYENKGFDAFVFSFTGYPEILYTGEWGEDVKIEWRDGARLFINDDEYSVSK